MADRMAAVPLALVVAEAQAAAPLGSPHSAMRRPEVVMAARRARVVERMAVGRARAVRAAVAMARVAQAAEALVALTVAGVADRPARRALVAVRMAARMAVVQTMVVRAVEALVA